MMPLLFILLAFSVSVYFIIRPRDLKVPMIGRRLTLDYAFGSVLGAALLLLLGVLTPQEAWGALIGRLGFSPYTIIILFMSMAYISVSLDSTGFFEYAALKMVQRCGGDGRKLFFRFYFLSSIITLFTSNDIVILTLTPIIFYFGKHARINPIPYLIAEFFAANVWSMFLYIGNPTNIIVASASGLSFLEYSYWMVLPTIAAGIANTALLYLVCRKMMTRRFRAPGGIRPEEFLKNRPGAFVGLSVFVLALAGMALAPSAGMEMWAVSFALALCLFAFDAISALYEYPKKEMVFYHVFKRHAARERSKVYRFRLHMIAERMPWKVVPFLLCSFVMVEALVRRGLTDLAASAISWLSPNAMSASISMGFISGLSANVLNNQPMTVLFTKVMESPAFLLEGGTRMASLYSLIIGSNLGANLTIIGALAGIMWVKILRGKGLGISYGSFARVGFLVTPLVILAACVTLGLEIMLAGI